MMAPPRSKAEEVSKSGIQTSPSGNYIPSSTRADGSVRKEIRIRPGYKPPEDVEVYKNRTAEAWKTRGKGGVPGAEFVEEVGKGRSGKSKASGKKLAGQEKVGNNVNGVLEAKKEQQVEESEKDQLEKNETRREEEKKVEPEPEPDPEAEKEKEGRKLNKKLRQARELQQKKEKGDDLLPEQFEKVIKINELIRQLDALGFDSDGQKKKG